MPFQHMIKQGDTIIKLAEKYGIPADKIWDHPANSELKKKFDNANILSPGASLTIPDMETKEESISTGSRHRFRKKTGKTTLKIQLKEDDEPRSNIEYILDVDGKTIKGKTDGDGYLDQKIPSGAKKAVIYIGEDEEIPVQIGVLDPVTDTSGVQKRLNNLGYACGEPDGELNDSTAAALRGFQQDNSLEVTGKPDKATQDKLVQIHGC